MSKPITKRKNLKNDGIIMPFDIPLLDGYIKYARCEYVSKPQLASLQRLLKSIDINQYSYNIDIYERLALLSCMCEAYVDKHISDDSILLSYLNENLNNAKDIIKNINFEKNQLNDSECNLMTQTINERIQYIYIYQTKDELMTLLEEFDKVNITSYQDLIIPMKAKLSELMVKLQNVSASDELIRSFNFSDEQFMDLLTKIHAKAKKPSTVLMTGIRQLNAILSPGFQSGRLYTFLGGTGRFKSGTLWNITDQIRQFNPHISPVENGMRKTILFITMENTIYETIIRLFDMYNDTGKDIKELEVEEVARILREKGRFEFTNDDGIDIEMKYYSDLEIATSDIYTLVQELADLGKKVIAVVLDYILKIDSAKESYGDERLRLSFAGRELKAIAQNLDIPVITAMQINREGNNILESSMQENKEDIGRFIGTAQVGTCWDLIQESDWVCFINLEMQQSTKKWFLSFKRLKIRGKKDPMSLDYFNHPFVNNNGIRLEPDVNKPEPISIISLASDLVSVDENVPNTAARQRPRIDGPKAINKKSGNRDNQAFKDVALKALMVAS